MQKQKNQEYPHHRWVHSKKPICFTWFERGWVMRL